MERWFCKEKGPFYSVPRVTIANVAKSGKL
jgi:hypothetical protein